MSIAYKEGIKIPPPALNEIILASNQDVRQVNKSLENVLLCLCLPVSLLTSAGFSPGDP